MKNVYRTCELQTISEGLKHLLATYHLESKYTQALVMVKWDALVGTQIIKRTEKIYFKQHTMFVKLDSAPLRHHLNTQKKDLIAKLNSEVGETVVQELVFL